MSFAINGCLVAGLLVATVAPAGAQPTQGSAASIAEFDRGRKLMKSKQYAEACAAFERSQELEAAAGTLYNLAGCYVQLGKLASAWAAFRELSATDPNLDRRAASADAARALDQRLPKLVVTIAEPPADLLVTLNGFDITTALGVDNPVDLGTHELVARATGYADLKLAPAITQEGTTVSVELVLVPRSTGAAPVSAPGVQALTGPGGSFDVDTPAELGSRQRLGGIVVAGLGGALAVTGLVFGAQARSRWNDADARCPGGVCADPADVTLGASAQDRATLSTVFVIGGVAAIAGGIAIYLTAPRGGVQVRPTPTGLALGGSF